MVISGRMDKGNLDESFRSPFVCHHSFASAFVSCSLPNHSRPPREFSDSIDHKGGLCAIGNDPIRVRQTNGGKRMGCETPISEFQVAGNKKKEGRRLEW
jgi:hypothetical protein